MGKRKMAWVDVVFSRDLPPIRKPTAQAPMMKADSIPNLLSLSSMVPPVGLLGLIRGALVSPHGDGRWRHDIH